MTINANLIDTVVNTPAHYRWEGGDVVHLMDALSYSNGSILKYLLRAGRKKYPNLSDLESEILDYSKAEWYTRRVFENSDLRESSPAAAWAI